MNSITIPSIVLLLLGFGVRLLYIRLNKAWLLTVGMTILTGIVWISSVDQYFYNNEGEIVLAALSTMLLAGTVLGEITVQLLRYHKKREFDGVLGETFFGKKVSPHRTRVKKIKSPENTSKGEPT